MDLTPTEIKILLQWFHCYSSEGFAEYYDAGLAEKLELHLKRGGV